MKKRLVTGIKPTGDIHIGNYFGVMKDLLAYQNQYDCFIFIADYHALNQTHNPKKLKKDVLEVGKAFLAIGLDPQKATLFRQSEIGPVTDLCWILNSITPVGLLKRAHAYKDALAKNKPVNMGLFDYPVLMAADILIYEADVVPVGLDQKQHLEMTEEIARKFNNIYGETFKIPEPIIKKEIAQVKGIDGRKMSKSYNNTIGLFDPKEEVKRKVMSIVTDSRKADEPKDPETCNIFALHKLFSKDQLEEIARGYRAGTISYQESKEILAKNINKFLEPIRKKGEELDKNPEIVIKALEEGGKRAKEIAQKILDEVKSKIGIKLCQ
jgi:tryptophanyl-tRNA synthetase